MMRLTGKGKVTKYWVTLLLMVCLLISVGFPTIETAYGQAASPGSGPPGGKSENKKPPKPPKPPKPLGIETNSPLDIVQNGQAQAAIILPANADARLRASADTLAAYVQKSTGAVLPVWDEDGVPAGNGQLQDPVWIHVGASGLYPDPHLDDLLEGVEGDGFVIHFHGNRIVIAGATSWGTQFGVYDFLERYIGVRWLMPGPDGEDVPQHLNVSIPQQDVIEEPVFMSRAISPLMGAALPVQAEWAKRNRLHGRIEFHHNVHSLFPPQKYGQSHPEFYPVRNGTPYIPPVGTTTYWQPCYSEPATVQAAVYGIIEYFTNHPDADSFSLGVNDGRGYCETEPNHPNYPGQLNSVGLPDMSDIYYGWVNAVVEDVLAVFPDKWFGLLAYDNVMDPPSFPLNPRVIPFITQDRMSWIDPAVESVAKQKLEEWGETAGNVGWYDYIYGNPYLVPRMYTNQMAENYVYAANEGVQAHYAELYPNWGEGPKPWIAAKLQWNPNQNVEALLDEWYVRAVGEAAADDLRAYYEYWENFWTQRVPNSEWFESWKNATYLDFADPGYMNLVTPQDMAYSRSLLETVWAQADTASRKARANLLLRAFEYYEASALSYPKNVDPIADAQAALSLLDSIDLEETTEMAQKRIDLVNQFKQDAVLVHTIDPKPYPLLNWSGLNANEFWELVRFMQLHEPNGGTATQSVYNLSTAAEPTKLREYGRLLQEASLNQFPLNGNPSFEEAGGISPWGTWIDKPPAVISRSQDIARPGGSASLLVSNLTKGGPIQTFEVKPGLYASQVYYYTPPGTQTKAIIRLSFNYLDKDNKVLKNTITPARFVSTTAGQWASVRVLDDVPASVNGTQVKKVQMIVYINDVESTTQLYLDDVTFFQSNENFINTLSFWKVYDYITTNQTGSGTMRTKLEIVAQKDEASDSRELARLLLNMLDGAQPVNPDPSFALGAGSGPGSTVTYWSQFGSMQRVTDNTYIRSGSASILLAGPAALRITAQYFTFQPGPAAVRVYYKLPAGTTSAGTIQLRLNLNTAGGEPIAVLPSKTVPVSAPSNGWASIDFAVLIPASYNNLAVGKVQFVIVTNGLESATPIYLDDAAIYQ